MSTRYIKPDWVTTNVFNPAIALFMKMGISVYGSRILAVRGRTTGEWRTTPVNVLTYAGQRYLVSPRGETQWVRNIRASGGGELRLGPASEEIRVEEIPNEKKADILREYLKHWAFEVGAFFDGVGSTSSVEELRRISPSHPVFRINMRNEEREAITPPVWEGEQVPER